MASLVRDGRLRAALEHYLVGDAESTAILNPH
jgi:hypothetical protein